MNTTSKFQTEQYYISADRGFLTIAEQKALDKAFDYARIVKKNKFRFVSARFFNVDTFKEINAKFGCKMFAIPVAPIILEKSRLQNGDLVIPFTRKELSDTIR